jgi:hypothetical protein
MFRAGLYARVSTTINRPSHCRSVPCAYSVRRGWTIALQVKEVVVAHPNGHCGKLLDAARRREIDVVPSDDWAGARPTRDGTASTYWLTTFEILGGHSHYTAWRWETIGFISGMVAYTCRSTAFL